MLTIENEFKIKHAVVGTNGFYVSEFKAMVITDVETRKVRNAYHIEVTNRKYIVQLELDRTASNMLGHSVYALRNDGLAYWLTIDQIKDIDTFLEKINMMIK